MANTMSKLRTFDCTKDGCELVYLPSSEIESEIKLIPSTSEISTSDDSTEGDLSLPQLGGNYFQPNQLGGGLNPIMQDYVIDVGNGAAGNKKRKGRKTQTRNQTGGRRRKTSKKDRVAKNQTGGRKIKNQTGGRKIKNQTGGRKIENQTGGRKIENQPGGRKRRKNTTSMSVGNSKSRRTVVKACSKQKPYKRNGKR